MAARLGLELPSWQCVEEALRRSVERVVDSDGGGGLTRGGWRWQELEKAVQKLAYQCRLSDEAASPEESSFKQKTLGCIAVLEVGGRAGQERGAVCALGFLGGHQP